MYKNVHVLFFIKSLKKGPDLTAHPCNLIGAVINHFMARVTNKIASHRKCSVAFRVLVSLKMSVNFDDKYLCSVQTSSVVQALYM